MHRFYLVIVFCFALIGFSNAQSEKMLALEVKGDTLMNREDFAGALKYFAKIIKSSKEKDKFYYGVLYKSAVSYYSLGQFDNALQAVEEFIPAYPNSPQPHLLRAFIYREKDDNEKQLASLEEILKLNPGSPELMKWRAMLYLDEDENEVALVDLKKVRAQQDDAEVETYLGLAYYHTGKMDSALVSLNKAIELDATYQPAYLYAASFCLQEAAYDLALTYVNLALRLDPKNPSALFYKGIALIEKDKVDEACSFLAKAFRLGVDDAGDYLKKHCYGDED